MMKIFQHPIVAVSMMIMCVLTVAGCEVGINPLIIDGAAASDPVRVDIDAPFPPAILASSNVDLDDILSDLGNADSIRLYNLTLLATNTTTAPATRVNGSIRIRMAGSARQDTLANFSGLLLTEFLTERSIFDKTISGFTVHPQGIATLVLALRSPRPLPMATVYIDAFADHSSLHLTLHLKVYAQIFTMP